MIKYHKCLLFQKTRKNTTVTCNSWHIFKCSFQVHFVRLASLVSSPSPPTISALCKFTKLVITPFMGELFSYPLSNKALPAKPSSPEGEDQSSVKITAHHLFDRSHSGHLQSELLGSYDICVLCLQFRGLSLALLAQQEQPVC